MTLNRRSFLVGGAASAAASISTFAHAANPCSTPTTWDKTYDVIVIGSGGAGLSAGIVAKEKGANAVVLEKLSIPGGNTMVSGGGLNAAVEADYKKAGIEDSPQLHTIPNKRWLRAISAPTLLLSPHCAKTFLKASNGLRKSACSSNPASTKSMAACGLVAAILSVRAAETTSKPA